MHFPWDGQDKLEKKKKEEETNGPKTTMKLLKWCWPLSVWVMLFWLLDAQMSSEFWAVLFIYVWLVWRWSWETCWEMRTRGPHCLCKHGNQEQKDGFCRMVIQDFKVQSGLIYWKLPSFYEKREKLGTYWVENWLCMTVNVDNLWLRHLSVHLCLLTFAARGKNCRFQWATQRLAGWAFVWTAHKHTRGWQGQRQATNCRRCARCKGGMNKACVGTQHTNIMLTGFTTYKMLLLFWSLQITDTNYRSICWLVSQMSLIKAKWLPHYWTSHSLYA